MIKDESKKEIVEINNIIEEKKTLESKNFNWINRMAKKRIETKTKKEKSDNAFHNNLIDQILDNLKTKDHLSMNRKSTVKRGCTDSKKLGFQNFYNFAKNEVRRESIGARSSIKPEFQKIFNPDLIANKKTTKATSIVTRKGILSIVSSTFNSKRKLRKIFHVISWCLYILRYHNRFGIDPKIFEDIFHNKEKDKINLFMTKEKIENFEYLQKTEEQSQEDKFPWYIINPDHCFTRYWNILIFILLIYIVLIGSIRVCFTENYLNPLYLNIFPFDMTVEILFFINIVLKFFTSYRTKIGLVTKISKIAKNYAKSWFIFDFLSQLPNNFNDINANPGIKINNYRRKSII